MKKLFGLGLLLMFVLSMFSPAFAQDFGGGSPPSGGGDFGGGGPAPAPSGPAPGGDMGGGFPGPGGQGQFPGGDQGGFPGGQQGNPSDKGLMPNNGQFPNDKGQFPGNEGMPFGDNKTGFDFGNNFDKRQEIRPEDRKFDDPNMKKAFDDFSKGAGDQAKKF
ncbi:MAG: hypothetical protein Q7K42_02535, partial [Candidatus Diapherotrites archaeon]|nr:hypothetical protein [Candidatus Diapherotrites archaeon]